MTEPTRRAVFFDRDGTLVDTVDYLGKPDDVSLLTGSAAPTPAQREPSLRTRIPEPLLVCRRRFHTR